MIYRMYFDARTAGGEWETGHRCCEELLDQALEREHGLRLHGLSVVRNRWGKPGLRDYPSIRYNLSHCGGLAACVLSGVPVGIDAERIRPLDMGAAQRSCTREELEAIESSGDPNRMFFIHWTLKESFVKALGMGLSHPLRQAVFRVEGHRILEGPPGFQFTVLEGGGFVTAVCYRRRGPSVMVREDDPRRRILVHAGPDEGAAGERNSLPASEAQ